MDGAIIFYFALATIILVFTIWALVSVTFGSNKREKSDGPGAKAKLGPIGQFQQSLVEINRVPDPKGRGTVWTPSE